MKHSASFPSPFPRYRPTTSSPSSYHSIRPRSTRLNLKMMAINPPTHTHAHPVPLSTTLQTKGDTHTHTEREREREKERREAPTHPPLLPSRDYSGSQVLQWEGRGNGGRGGVWNWSPITTPLSCIHPPFTAHFQSLLSLSCWVFIFHAIRLTMSSMSRKRAGLAGITKEHWYVRPPDQCSSHSSCSSSSSFPDNLIKTSTNGVWGVG